MSSISPERLIKRTGKPDVRLAWESDGNIFVAIGGLQIEITSCTEGIDVNIVDKNEVVGHLYAEYKEAA